MRGTLRRAFVWSVGLSLLGFVAGIAALVLGGELAGISGFLIVLIQPLQVFAWATVLSLYWWTSGGLLLAAFMIVHRRTPPEAPGAPRAG